MRSYYLIIFLILVQAKSFAQLCDCKANFEWVKSTFETNDAGFSYHLKQSGAHSYSLFNKSIAKKLSTASTVTTCQDVLQQWLDFFRTEHIGLRAVNLPIKKNVTRISKIRETKNLDEEKIDRYRKLMKSHKPSLTKVDQNTLLFRIPHMWYQYKKDIDSIIKTNKQLILRTESLIIDIRNNGGGSDYTYEAILPILYTNPIRTLGASFLSSKLNNKMLYDIVQNQEYDNELRKWAQSLLNRAKNHLNKLVPMDSVGVDILEQDTTYPSPKQIAILIDNNVASAAEQFLLSAKQSKKVKLYGTTTAGALDFANVNEVVSPDKKFVLSYALSRSMRIPEMAIDQKGVQPDYYLDSSIPKYRWIEYVTKMMKE